MQVLDETESTSFLSRSGREWRKTLSDAFLPVGFPHSVSDDYLRYQTYDSLQAFFSEISGLLAGRAILQGLGVGDANSSATAALLLNILRDGMSRIATIVFAHQFGLRIEPDAKRYRFLADVFNDLSWFLDLYSPYFGTLGKVIALGTGQGLRSLCGVAGNASKAALSVHFAKHDNLAELNTKEASQETAVSLVGMLVGTVVIQTVEDHTTVVILTTFLVLAHLWMNYLGVRCLCMDTLNRQRATILFKEYLSTGKVLTPVEVAAREKIIFWSPVLQNRHGEDVARVEFAENYGRAMERSKKHPGIYIIDDVEHTTFVSRGAPNCSMPIRMLLWSGSQSESRAAIYAWFKAMAIAWVLDKELGFTPSQHSMFNLSNIGKDNHVSDSDMQWWMEHSSATDTLCDKLVAKGWNVNTQAFETRAPVRLTSKLADTKLVQTEATKKKSE